MYGNAYEVTCVHCFINYRDIFLFCDQVGYANGVIQKEYMRQFAASVYDYFVTMAVDALGDKVSPVVQAMIIVHGLNYALDWAAEVTAPFTPQEFYDELQGMADGSGVDYQTLLRLNM